MFVPDGVTHLPRDRPVSRSVNVQKHWTKIASCAFCLWKMKPIYKVSRGARLTKWDTKWKLRPTQKTAQRLADESQFDILVVDLGLLDRDGISLILLLRELGLKAPVLILSAGRSVDDRVRRLEQGGDELLAV